MNMVGPTNKNSRVYLVLGLAAALIAARFAIVPYFSSASDLTPANIADAVNQERASRNITTLTYNTKLAAAADYKANDMITRDYFSHVDPDGHYIWDKIVAEGYTPYTVLGENLAIDFPDTQGLMDAWINSPTHRANILNAAFKDQGVGVAFGNAALGQYNDAIANTFGAQPTSAQIAETTTPTPHPNQPPKPSQPAATTPIQPKPTTQPQPLRTAESPQIVRDSVNIVPTTTDTALQINIALNVSGPVQSVSATINGKSSDLQKTGINEYAGTVELEKYFNYQEQNLTLIASDGKGNQDQDIIPLSGYPLPSAQNPKTLGNLAAKIQQPDLYNTFKYIVLIFGGLFILFMIGDALHITKKSKNKSGLLDSIDRGATVILLFILLSTLLLVSWWH